MASTRTSFIAIVRLVSALLVVAIAAASFAMVFRVGLSFVYRSLFHAHDVLEAFEHLPSWLRMLVPAVGGLGAGLLARMSPKASGVGDVMEAVVLGGRRLSLRATLWKAAGSFVAIGTGGSIGREGPLIQFGGSVGSRVASAFRVEGPQARALIAAGTAAGFAAAYNTPFAAVLFVLEIVMGFIAVEPLVMILVATAIATALVRASVGGGPIYGERTYELVGNGALFAYALLGVVAAVIGQLFMRGLALGEKAFARTKLPQPWRAGLGGAMVGVLALWVPEVAGNGYEPLNLLLDGRYAGGVVVVFLVTKALATMSSVSSGSPGGVFTPSLFLGGAVGFLFGTLLVRAGLADGPGGYALVGMAAAIAATTHAPLMAAVLAFELSGDYAIVLPLVIATAAATLVSRRLGPDSVYTSELRRRGVDWDNARGAPFRNAEDPSPRSPE